MQTIDKIKGINGDDIDVIVDSDWYLLRQGSEDVWLNQGMMFKLYKLFDEILSQS